MKDTRIPWTSGLGKLVASAAVAVACVLPAMPALAATQLDATITLADSTENTELEAQSADLEAAAEGWIVDLSKVEDIAYSKVPVYTSEPVEPSYTITASNGETLVKGTDYTVTYSNNVEVGTATATFKGISARCIGTKTSNFTISHAVVDNTFDDLLAGSWYVRQGWKTTDASTTIYFDYVYAKGIMSGYSGSNNFGVEDHVTRGQVATILYRYAEGKTADNTNNNVTTSFSDVPANQYYTAAVKWCADNGIVTGYTGTGEFRPDNGVTREEVATMLARFYYYKTTGKATIATQSTTDMNKLDRAGDVNSWAIQGMAWAVNSGVISGIGGTDLAPGESATRTQMVKMSAVTCKKVDEA